MRIQLMKDVDRWAGGLACILLDLLNRPRRWLTPPPAVPESVSTILVTKYLGMGSLVLATPMVAALRRRFRGARVVLLTFESNHEIANILDVFDEVHTIDSRHLTSLSLDTLRALSRLWRLGVDVVCDLEFFTRYSTTVGYLTGARVRVGYWSRITWRGNLLTHAVYYNGMRHITRVFLAQAEALGAEVEEGEEAARRDLPRLEPGPEEARSVREQITRASLDPAKPFLLVNPNASELCLERRWIPERFAAVVDGLLKEDRNLQAIFVGSAAESSYTEDVRNGCRERSRTANLAGVLSLRELLEALRMARLFLTVDSGPLHLAALTDTPTIGLFGPETPSLYGPVGPRQRVFYAGVYCSPCLNVYNSKTAPCNGNNICMQAIAAPEVLAAARELLSTAPLGDVDQEDEQPRLSSLSH